MHRLLPTPYRHRWPQHTARLCVALLLCGITSSCGDCSCAKSASKQAVDNSSKHHKRDVSSGSAHDATNLEERAQAIVRIKNIASFDVHMSAYLTRAAPKDASKDTRKQGERDPLKVLRWKDIMATHIGHTAMPGIREDGNLEFAFFTQDKESRRKSASAKDNTMPKQWIMAVPVLDPVAFLKAQNAEEDPTEVGLVAWDGPLGKLYAHKTPLTLPATHCTDTKTRLIISSWRHGAIHGAKFLTEHVGEQYNDLIVHTWPRRLGIVERAAQITQELRLRLSTSGHTLLPARANLINFESNLYALLAHPEHLPKTAKLYGTFKIRENKPKSLRLFLDIPTKDVPLLATVRRSMRPRKGSTPPSIKGATASLSMRLNRNELEDLFDSILPTHLRMLLAARGEDEMVVLRSLVFDILEHNRGATTVGFYPAQAPLSAETLIAWDAMDLEKISHTMEVFAKKFIQEFWLPMHLADKKTIRQGSYTNKEFKVRGFYKTFEVVFAQAKSMKRLRMGICSGTSEKSYYYVYFGVEPCAKLDQALTDVALKTPPPLILESDLASLIDLLYVPPGQSKTFDLDDTRVELHAHMDAQKDTITYNMFMKKGDAVRAILKNYDILSSLWATHKELDLMSMVMTTGMEQAIYQEPALMTVGPPGLLGTMPPSYLLGMPFSIPPTPPTQLREAILGKDTTKAPTPP